MSSRSVGISALIELPDPNEPSTLITDAPGVVMRYVGTHESKGLTHVITYKVISFWGLWQSLRLPGDSV